MQGWPGVVRSAGLRAAGWAGLGPAQEAGIRGVGAYEVDPACRRRAIVLRAGLRFRGRGAGRRIRGRGEADRDPGVAGGGGPDLILGPDGNFWSIRNSGTGPDSIEKTTP